MFYDLGGVNNVEFASCDSMALIVVFMMDLNAQQFLAELAVDRTFKADGWSAARFLPEMRDEAEAASYVEQ